MKILVLSNSTAGLVKFRKELINELQKKHDVYVASIFDDCIEEIKEIAGNKLREINFSRRKINFWGEVHTYRIFEKVIDDINPDLIISYTIKPNIYGGMVAKKKKISFFPNITGLGSVFYNGGLLKQFVIKLYKIAFKQAGVVFFENESNKRVFVEEKIVPEEKCVVLNGAGVNTDRFVSCDYPSEENRNFIFIGRLMKEKGVDELLQAFLLLHSEHPEIKLIIAGAYEEGYEKILKNHIDAGYVEYLGWVDDVRPYLKESMCSVLPSYHEGLSNTLLESAAMSRPVITSNVPGCKETVIDHVSGYLAEAGNADDLYNKMKLFYELPYEAKKKMGEAGRKHVSARFDKRAVVKDTIEHLGI